jgi:hypothetical protein
MSQLNKKYIEDLKDFEYHFRDGLVFTAEQKEEIRAVCKQIIEITEE